MYDLHHLKGNTYYIDGPTNCGLYKLNDQECVLIDCGKAKEGPIIETVLRRNKLKLKYIICTHSHPDHSGANQYLAKVTGCKIIASKIERAFFRDSKLDIGFLYGGFPLDEFDNKLMHIDDQTDIYSLDEIPEGLRSFKLPGHHYGMIGIRTSDGVFFVADAYDNKELIEREHIMLIYDVKGYLETLDFIKKFEGRMIVPAHDEPTDTVNEIIEINRNKIYEIIDLILDILKKPHSIEEIVDLVFSHYDLYMSYNKYLLYSSTIRSYLAYLSNEKRIRNYFKNNRLMFISEEALDNF